MPSSDPSCEPPGATAGLRSTADRGYPGRGPGEPGCGSASDGAAVTTPLTHSIADEVVRFRLWIAGSCIRPRRQLHTPPRPGELDAGPIDAGAALSSAAPGNGDAIPRDAGRARAQAPSEPRRTQVQVRVVHGDVDAAPEVE